MESDRNTSPVSETEDISSDFFDDFSKEEFMEGLSVIDSWDDGPNPDSRIDAETVDRVKDLRELLGNSGDKKRDHEKLKILITKYKIDRRLQNKKKTQNTLSTNKKDDFDKFADSLSKQNNNLNKYIKPGSRRDPNKTKLAIKKDKEVKVKQYLAKHLEDDLRPPGTELEDYFQPVKKVVKKDAPSRQSGSPQRRKEKKSPKLKSKQHAHSKSPSLPSRQSVSPQRIKEKKSPKLKRKQHTQSKSISPARRRRRNSPSRRSPRRASPHHFHNQRYPIYNERRSSIKLHSQRTRSPSLSPRLRHDLRHGRRSPSPHWSVRRSPSPHRSMRRSPSLHRSVRRSHSPHRSVRRSPSLHRSVRRSPSPLRNVRQSRSPTNKFLYPGKTFLDYAATTAQQPYVPHCEPQWEINTVPMNTVQLQYTDVTEYSYLNTGGPTYPPNYSGQYDYGAPCSAPAMMPVTPLYDTNAIATPLMTAAPQPVPPPVPPAMAEQHPNLLPRLAPLAPSAPGSEVAVKPALDALTQLLADGKISKEDYLKLAPNKGPSGQETLNLKDKVELLTRCYEAVNKLTKLQLPNRLMMPAHLREEPKAISPLYCSPLKRHPTVNFQFTNASSPALEQRNKQLLESIVSAVGLENVVVKRKSTQKDTKEVAVQTTKPYCVTCELRDSTKHCTTSTTVDREEFTKTTHTQVDDKDLASSKTVFIPGGGIADGAPVSISHLTPAQLVSQLAARAKTLKQNPEPIQEQHQFSHRNMNNQYQYGDRHNYHDNYNYRY